MSGRAWVVSCLAAVGCTIEPGGGDGANPIGFQVSEGPFQAAFGAERSPLWTIANQTEETCWAMMPDGDLLLSTGTRPQGLRRVGVDLTERWSTTPIVEGSLGFDSCGGDSVRLATGPDGSSYLFGAFAEQFGNASSRNGVVRLTADGAIAYLVELPAGVQAHRGIGLPDGSMIVVTGTNAEEPENIGNQHFLRLDPTGAQISETLLTRVHVADYESGTDFVPGVSSGDGLPNISSLTLARDGGLLVGGTYTFGPMSRAEGTTSARRVRPI